ncbi:MAG: hypothetical protein HDS67_02370 [Bacteroidales bacterium]|nr:hypothetical protein [Bacteroidales bacterium]
MSNTNTRFQGVATIPADECPDVVDSIKARAEMLRSNHVMTTRSVIEGMEVDQVIVLPIVRMATARTEISKMHKWTDRRFTTKADKREGVVAITRMK